MLENGEVIVGKVHKSGDESQSEISQASDPEDIFQKRA
jgi:hypothetical protein